MRGASPLCRDLKPIKKVSYFCVRDHMRNEPARFAGISLFLSEISAGLKIFHVIAKKLSARQSELAPLMFSPPKKLNKNCGNKSVYFEWQY